MTGLGRRSFLWTLSLAASAHGLGRTPFGGTLRLRLPLYFGGVDPHRLDDPLSALFAPALADPLYAFDESGEPYPALASALPERTSTGTRVSLRAELKSAHGKALSARDVLFSLKRAQAAGGASVLGAFRGASLHEKDPLSIVFPDADPVALARSLACPLTAIVPRGFSPSRPDGTGAFTATLGAGTLTLTRNERAARAAAYLDRVELSRAPDLADALRAFETGAADVGWLGNGLYRQRAGAHPLEGPVFGWIVLRTGLEAKTWGAPGVAQQLASALPAEALSHFGVRALPGSGGVRWGGSPSALLVPDDAPLTLEMARALEPLLGGPGHEVRATALPRAAWLDARRSRRFSLMLDFVRSASADPRQGLQALLAAVDPALARHPPHGQSSLQELTRALPLGLLGEIRVSGSRLSTFAGLETWQLGSVRVSDDAGG